MRRASSRCAEERLRVSQVNQCTDGAPTCSVADRRSILPPFEPWPRQLDRKLDSYLTGYSTATRQLLDSYSTATRQLLDRDSSTATRQFSTDLDRTPPDGEVRVQGRTCNPNPEIWEFEILAPSKFRDVEIPRFQQMSEIWEM